VRRALPDAMYSSIRSTSDYVVSPANSVKTGQDRDTLTAQPVLVAPRGCATVPVHFPTEGPRWSRGLDLASGDSNAMTMPQGNGTGRLGNRATSAARTFHRVVQIPTDRVDDWDLLERVETVVRQHADESGWFEVQTHVKVNDEGGSYEVSSIAEARQEAQNSRHKVIGVTLKLFGNGRLDPVEG
jgi:hypothetical protein